jgi:hypothetical protein
MKRSNFLAWRQISVFIISLLISQTGFSQTAANKPGYYIFPAAGRLAGIGAFYGLGFNLENLASSSLDVAGGKTAGRVEAQGIVLSDVALLNDSIALSLGYVQVDRLFFDISYTRGTAEDDPVTQVGKAQGAAFNIHWKLFEPGVSVNTTLASWEFKFDEYLTYQEEETIELPGIHLGDLKTTFLVNDLEFNLIDSKTNPTSGLLIGLNLTSLFTNTEFSDTNTANYFVNAYLPVKEHHTWVFRGFGSDTAVTNEKLTDIDEIKSKLAVDCNQISDPGKKTECEELRDNIATYLAAHNKYGTATPLGGHNMLRSYRELRFRGAHSRFLGTEMRFNFPGSGLVSNYQVAVFYEKGTAADHTRDIEKNYQASYGLALRMMLGKLMVRLEAANGDEGPEWFLIAGNPW